TNVDLLNYWCRVPSLGTWCPPTELHAGRDPDDQGARKPLEAGREDRLRDGQRRRDPGVQSARPVESQAHRYRTVDRAAGCEEEQVMSQTGTESASTPEQLVATLAADSGSAGRRFSKSDLLPLLSGTLGGEEAFARIRMAAKSGLPLGATYVHSEGERRGTRYVFANTSTPPAPRPAASVAAATRAAVTGGMRPFPPPTRPDQAGKIEVFAGDNLPIISNFEASSFDLIYIDPPFNTGRSQSRTRIKTERDDDGDRTGFQGRRYRTTVLGTSSFADRFDDYLQFLAPRLEQAHRLLKPSGSLFLHLDYREVHYAKVLLDEIFGRESFINEIIWSYDYGARATNRWSPKHDTILWYAKSPTNYCFNFDETDRIPYMAPSLVGEEKAARGKT